MNQPPAAHDPDEDLASGFVCAQNWDSETAWGAGNRFNERGNQGTWFTYEIAEPTVSGPRNETLGPISLAFADQRVEDSDWDYNDWVGDLDTHGTFVGADLTHLEFNITPLARGAANRHDFNLVLPAGTFGSDGTYMLESLAPDGAELSTRTGALRAETPTDIRTWDRSLDALPRMSNTGDGTVSEPLQTARLSIEFDAGPNPFSFGDPDEMGIHSENRFFQPYLFDNSTGQNFAVAAGDIRMLAVPGDWRWPTERTRIWNAYDAVTESGFAGPPVFEPRWWDLDLNPLLVYEAHDPARCGRAPCGPGRASLPCSCVWPPDRVAWSLPGLARPHVPPPATSRPTPTPLEPDPGPGVPPIPWRSHRRRQPSRFPTSTSPGGLRISSWKRPAPRSVRSAMRTKAP